MNQVNWIDVFNSATTFGILLAIAISIWILILKKDSSRPRAPKR